MDNNFAQTITDFKDALTKYIVTPIAQFGLGGFVFDVEGDTGVTLSTDITDHYTESNVAIQDHIAIRPKRVRLDTFVGELAYYGDPASQSSTQKLAQKLTVLNSYIPPLTAGAQQAAALFSSNSPIPPSFTDIAAAGLNIFSLVKNIVPPISKQQKAYQYFKAMMEQKILVSVQTPFEFCTNMAIENIFAIQDERTRTVSNFSIVLKEIRMASTSLISISSLQQAGGRAALQKSPEAFGGKITGVPVPDPSAVIEGS